MQMSKAYYLNTSDAKQRKEDEAKLAANITEITRLIAESSDLANKLGFQDIQTLLKDAGALNHG